MRRSRRLLTDSIHVPVERMFATSRVRTRKALFSLSFLCNFNSITVTPATDRIEGLAGISGSAPNRINQVFVGRFQHTNRSGVVIIHTEFFSAALLKESCSSLAMTLRAQRIHAYFKRMIEFRSVAAISDNHLDGFGTRCTDFEGPNAAVQTVGSFVPVASRSTRRRRWR
jgi:hypothetical protein